MALTRLAKRLIVFLLACSSFLPLTAVAQEIYFKGEEFNEPVDTLYWEHHTRDGIDVFLEEEYGGINVIFRNPISFHNARFYYTASFAYAHFNSKADFSSAQFYSEAHFFGAHFNSTVGFSAAQFHSTADFTDAQFDSVALFSISRFNSKASFFKSHFYSTAVFFDADFDSVANFFGSQFNSTADFRSADFHSTADFRSADFHSTANFFDAQFDSMANFRYAYFHSEANFREARFAGGVSFKYATLPDSLDFREVIDIAKEINFTYARPPGEKKKCRIALTGTDIDKIKMNMRFFELWFPADTTFKDSLAADDTIQVIGRIDGSSYDEQVSVYESVLKKLKEDGLMDSYRILDIVYREFKYRHEGGLNWYVANTFHRLWWNYGYNKELIFLWTIGFLFLFSVLNINFYRRLSENVYAIPFLGKWDYDSMRWPKSWIYYWLQVTTYTAIIFFGLKMDIAKFKEGVVRNHPLLFAYLMFIYVLGLICLGFIVNIIFTR